MLRRILAAHPGLLAQLDHAEVTSAWSEGSLSVDIEVPNATPAEGISGVLPGYAYVEDIGELLVWVDKGVLAALEYAWHTDEPPTELPSPDRITLV
ncbi:hypothetical protein ALI144C_30365 [Actinosynnema sp. ALI-1.44]|nr:hypothetical protein ALI144C_30365 [Actinosynnema sp. ALI-1.44]